MVRCGVPGGSAGAKRALVAQEPLATVQPTKKRKRDDDSDATQEVTDGTGPHGSSRARQKH